MRYEGAKPQAADPLGGLGYTALVSGHAIGFKGSRVEEENAFAAQSRPQGATSACPHVKAPSNALGAILSAICQAQELPRDRFKFAPGFVRLLGKYSSHSGEPVAPEGC
jgi:hypothetical protein